MRQIVQAWSIKTLQESVNIWKHITSKGKTFEDIEMYLKLSDAAQKASQDRTARRATEHQPVLRKKCPKCGLYMNLISITEDNVRSKWICMSACGSCQGKGCGYTQANLTTVEEEYSKLEKEQSNG